MSENICTAFKKDGEPCKANRYKDTPFCFSHQEDDEEKPLCGHINRHSKGANGELDNLACEKPVGHGGPHGAFHVEFRFYGEGLPVETTPKPNNWREWLDVAGTPASEIKPDPLSLKKLEVPEEVWKPQ